MFQKPTATHTLTRRFLLHLGHVAILHYDGRDHAVKETIRLHGVGPQKKPDICKPALCVAPPVQAPATLQHPKQDDALVAAGIDSAWKELGSTAKRAQRAVGHDHSRALATDRLQHCIRLMINKLSASGLLNFTQH